MLPTLARAGTFTVTTTSDVTDEADGLLTLREAINQSNASPGPDTITFDEDLSGEIITLTQGQLVISDSLHLDASALAEAPVIDADQKSRVMDFPASTGNLQISGLTLRNGRIHSNQNTAGGGNNAPGGGIRFASSGSLMLSRCTLTGNSASSEHTPPYADTIILQNGILFTIWIGENSVASGGGIHADMGSIILMDSTLGGNSVRAFGDGGNRSITYASAKGGAVFSGSGTITLTNSVLSGNTATTEAHYGKAFGGAIATSSGAVCLTATIARDNVAVARDGVGSPNVSGGAIRTESGTVELIRSTLADNRAEAENSYFSWGFSSGGGIATRSGAITLQDSRISGSFVDGSNSSGGGIYSALAEITLSRSQLTNNMCILGYFSAVGGGTGAGSGSVTIRDSTVSGNILWGGGYGGGIWAGGHVRLANATLSGNSLWWAGEPYGGGGVHCASLTSTNSTICRNSLNHGGGAGGIRVTTGPLVLRNTIIAENAVHGALNGNSASDLDAPDDPANTLEVSHSLIGNGEGARLEEAKVNLNNLVGVDPRLGPLGDYGGPTPTIPLLPGSPAIDAGTSSDLVLDQRGFPRVVAPDIGAVEYQGWEDFQRVADLDLDGDGFPHAVEQATGTDPYLADPADPRHLHLPAFNPEGRPMLSFGIAEDALPGTVWILERTTNLTTFHEIHRFDGTTHFEVDGVPISIATTAAGVTVTDLAPPPGRALYRLRVEFANPD